MITVVAKKEFFIRATGLLPNIIYYELLKLIYAYIKKREPSTLNLIFNSWAHMQMIEKA